MKNLIFTTLLLTGCASTTIYRPDGSRLAHFEGDVTNLSLRTAKDVLELTAETVDHSSATQAAGIAWSSGIGVAGTAASAVVLAKP